MRDRTAEKTIAAMRAAFLFVEAQFYGGLHDRQKIAARHNMSNTNVRWREPTALFLFVYFAGLKTNHSTSHLSAGTTREGSWKDFVLAGI